MDVWALVDSIVLAFQERVVLSAMPECVSFVRPFTRFSGVHIDRRYLCILYRILRSGLPTVPRRQDVPADLASVVGGIIGCTHMERTLWKFDLTLPP